MPRPHVVIVGAGFGGVWAARTLANKAVDVTLIDRNNYHTFFPLLYQVAAAFGLVRVFLCWPAEFLDGVIGVSLHCVYCRARLGLLARIRCSEDPPSASFISFDPLIRNSAMRALLVIALASAVLLPTGVEAQPRLMLGGGISSPNGDFSASAEAGYHLQVGLQVGIPTLPVGFRADGGIHRMGQGNAALVRTQILVGSLSGVLTLPGIGLSPYLLAGVGSYQTEAGLIGASEKMTETGYHGGFGVNIGAGGLGAFAEIRFVQIKSDTQTTRFIPMTFGIRL